MYLRPIWTKDKPYWALVKSVRQGKSVRQEVVAYLGSLPKKEQSRARALAQRLGLKPDAPELFDAPLTEEVVPIRLKGIALERARQPIPVERVERQIGRLLERSQRGGKFFTILCRSDPNRPAGVCLEWTLKDHVPAQRMEGSYLLRTNVRDWSAEDVWKTYIQLTQVEAAFRLNKSQLNIRPVYHHKTHRVRAHIFVCFLAYCLWKILEQWQSRAGLGDSPRTVLQTLATIQSADVQLPTDTGKTLRLRYVIRPEKHQQILLQRLGLHIPRRMNLPEGLQM